MYGHLEALPKQLALKGGGHFFSLWGKCSSDPSLSISYFPFISKWCLQCGIQSRWITPSHSNCLSKSLLFTVTKCRWEMHWAVNSSHHICTQRCISAEITPSPTTAQLDCFSILPRTDKSCYLTPALTCQPGGGCSEATRILQHAEHMGQTGTVCCFSLWFCPRKSTLVAFSFTIGNWC